MIPRQATLPPRRLGGRRGSRLATLAAGALFVTACSGSGSSPPAATSDALTSPATSPQATSNATPSAGLPASPGAGEFVNPVIAEDMPDPYVLDVGDRYYLYSTTNRVHNYPYATSDDLVNWTLEGDAMPQLPRWASGNTWAPEVTETSAGYVMYFTARATKVQRPDGQSAQCLGVAVSETPDGPFVDPNDEPLVCQADLGGTIDGSVVRDTDGSLWLIYKNDGNCCAMATRFFMRPMAEDGLSFAGKEVEVEGVRNDKSWEGFVVEAPTIHHRDGTYYLFFSANDYSGVAYAVGYATSDALTGPYVDAEENPILKTVPRVVLGPGHQGLIEDRDGDLWMVYHAWESTFSERQVWIDELAFEAGRPVVKGPDAGPQPVP